MDCSELKKSVSRQPSLKNLTQIDYGRPKPQQNKVRTCELNLKHALQTLRTRDTSDPRYFGTSAEVSGTVR